MMKSSAVVALALLESVHAFQAPAMKASTRSVGASMFEEGDIGVLPPLGVYDPLGLIEKRDMRRYEIMELKFTDVPAGLFASLEAVPTLGWLQIMAAALAC